jgi:hypothetical protein
MFIVLPHCSFLRHTILCVESNKQVAAQIQEGWGEAQRGELTDGDDVLAEMRQFKLLDEGFDVAGAVVRAAVGWTRP